jgi:hypothetical protein
VVNGRPFVKAGRWRQREGFKLFAVAACWHAHDDSRVLHANIEEPRGMGHLWNLLDLGMCSWNSLHWRIVAVEVFARTHTGVNTGAVLSLCLAS